MYGASDRGGDQSQCIMDELTTNDGGTGIMFVSCCTSAGVGVQRDCDQLSKTYSEAKAYCDSTVNRLCTKEEVLAGVTAGKGCGIDGKATSNGTDLNLVW